MKRTAINVVVDLSTGPEQRAWLRTVAVPLRSIRFGSLGEDVAPKLSSPELTYSTV